MKSSTSLTFYYVIAARKLAEKHIKHYLVDTINVIVCKKSNFKGDIGQKHKICYFMIPV